MRCLEQLAKSRYVSGWYDYCLKESISCDYLKSYLSQFCIVAEQGRDSEYYRSYGYGILKGREWKFYIDLFCGK